MQLKAEAQGSVSQKKEVLEGGKEMRDQLVISDLMKNPVMCILGGGCLIRPRDYAREVGSTETPTDKGKKAQRRPALLSQRTRQREA